ncbi:MAG: ParB/RepB/Spo0J family partition protein [Planctomycetota bacterium]|nr:ParB/RepB/Spo0J family partition protein [Planctomycetota bacterium]
MKPKRLGRGLKGLIKSSDPETLPPSRKTLPPKVEPVIPPPTRANPPVEAAKPETPVAEAPAAEVPAAEAPKAEAPVAEVADTPSAATSGAVDQEAAPADEPKASAPASSQATGVRHIPVGEVRPNPYQPRMNFGDDHLAELKASIAEHGVLQPVVVRPAAVGFELIAGERRLRATTALGHTEIPAIVRRAADEEMQTLALVENLQRVDLNAIEKAKALKAMMRNFGLTQEEAAGKVGKARTSISNLVRLLELPVVIQDLVSDGHLSGSQARAVLLAHGVERRLALARRAVKQGLTVRQIEKLAKAERGGSAAASEPDPYLADLEGRLRESLGTPVQLKAKGKGGSIVIGYHDAGELDRLLGVLGAE